MKIRIIFILLAAFASLSLWVPAVAQDEPELVPATVGDIVADPGVYFGQTVIVEDVLSEYVNSQSFLLGGDAAIGETRVIVINASGQPMPPNLFTGDRVVITGVVHPSLQTRLDNGEVTLPEDRAAYRRDLSTMGTGGDTTDMSPTQDPAMATEDPAMATQDPNATPEGSADGAATQDPAMATEDPAVATEDPAMAPTIDPANSAGDSNDRGSTDVGVEPVVDMSTMGGRAVFDFYYGGGFPETYDGYVIIEVTSLDDIELLAAESEG